MNTKVKSFRDFFVKANYGIMGNAMATFSQKIKEAFGYDRKDLGYYRDFALGITAGLSLMYCVMFASEIRIGRGSAFDWKI